VTEKSGGRPVAFIQVDLDGLWAVRRCYGSGGRPEQDDPVYSDALPALLSLFDRLGVKATFFVVGADVGVTWKRIRLEAVREQGHELANHSMTHDLRFARLEAEAVEREIVEAHQILGEKLGVEPRGFRAPGYGINESALGVLERLGYLYDSSLLPTRWGWVMRWLDRRISAAPNGGKFQYGTMRLGRGPLRPYHPDLRRPEKVSAEGEGLWEVPVSVSPRWRFPFHGGVGFLLGRAWVDRAVEALSRKVRFLNYVIHGIDLVDGRLWEVTPSRIGRRFFAGSARERLEFFAETCRHIAQRFEIKRTDRWIEEEDKRVKNRLTQTEKVSDY